jgi:hypothetical protein
MLTEEVMMLESMTIFDDCFINDDYLLEYTPKDWRYFIPQTINEANKLLNKTITKENIALKKQWIFENQVDIIEGIAEDNRQKNNDDIYSLGYIVEDGNYFRIYHDQNAGNIAMPVEEDEYLSAIGCLDLLPDNADDVILQYSVFSIIEHIANSAFISRELYYSHIEYQDYIINDKPIIDEIEVFLLSALALAVRADNKEHGNNGYLCDKANLATQAMQCLMKAKELIAFSELFESEKNTHKRIRVEVTAEVRNAYADSIRQEVKEQLEQENKKEKIEHAKMMALAKNAKHTEAKKLLANEWLSRYNIERWNSADAAAETLQAFMRSNGFSYGFRWIADTIRATAKAHNIKLR